jgi:REP element-mobilizing transposase RayT
MSHTVVNCLIHAVFSTKHRRNLISEDVRPRLWAYLGGIARENDMKALAVGGTANHAHVLLMLPATLSVAKAMQLLKGGSSKWVHDTFPTHVAFQWQEGYGAFSIGVSAVEQTVAYIENQETHHAGRSFEDEYRAFLDRHGVACEDRYVFG